VGHHNDEQDLLADLVRLGGVVALTGAGISTDSGIPDYRGATGAALRRHAPMTYREFTHDPQARHRYWARSHAGWPVMRRAQPNAGHRALAALERAGLVTSVITQNVDGLHGTAGSRQVIDLHGRLDRVTCLSCARITAREEIRVRLDAANPGWAPEPDRRNPDGDVDLTAEQVATFTMVDCTECQGPLKPDVVYFGESVPKERVARSYEQVDAASALLVLGSSLHVYSGRRFVMRAAERGIPVAIVNIGPTRGDDLAAVRVDASVTEILQGLAIHSDAPEAPLESTRA
jgi:NAD-dependent SIR2 family protein deacetylase